ncbi:putative glycosidase [Flavihumibacter petaseus NBRC 106054]|uniref:Putative glycosidase n=2 Tax=Flavihumibacter TaxID=1004301 RepID=A0A0E9N3K5_9BACT|nr:putative glycosidase [Flavihumibacter petaseus NBRC 106054]
MGQAGTLSFDDGWLFRRYGLQADGFSVAEEANISAVDFKDAGWQQLKLPHDWAITGPFRIDLAGETGKLPWKGIGWYRKHFALPAGDAGKRIFIDFDGAMAYAEVWLNGHYIGKWPYGYSSFRMDLTPYIKAGQENVIAVRLDTEKWDSRWYPGAGIYRHVWLVKTDPVHVGHWGTTITTPEVSAAAAAIKLNTVVVNHSGKPVSAAIRSTLFEVDAHNRIIREAGSMPVTSVFVGAYDSVVSVSRTSMKHPKIWDLEHPNRYIAKTSIEVKGKITDTYYTVFGIRTIRVTADSGVLLNGRRVQIQGTCNHHDLGALGAAMNKSALRRQLSILKEMGCNALRTSHNPPAPELLELADEMGFLVWDEAFDAWKTGKKKNDYNKIFTEWHEKDLAAMVRRDKNHPSVFIWSIGNEVMDQQDVALTRMLVDIVHKEDPTRPVSNGYNDPDGGRSSGAAQALDIMGVNYFFSQQPVWDKDPRYAQKPTIGSETSSCLSTRGEYFFGSPYRNWQISSYDVAKPGWGCIPDTQFNILQRMPRLLGEFVWTGFDYLGEPTPYGSDETNLLNFRNDPAKRDSLEKKLAEMKAKNPPSRSSYFGIVDLCGFPKDRYYLYQSVWRPELPMAHLLPHWNWPGRIDSIVPVHLYTSGDEAELFLNGKSLGRKKKMAGDYRLIWDSVVYQPGKLTAIAYKQGRRWATDSVQTTGTMSGLNLTANQQTVISNGEELLFVTATVVDENAMLVPGSSPPVQFDVEGPGDIVATDNGDPTSFESFQSHTKAAFNGMVLVIVKPKPGLSGKLQLHARSAGLQPASVSVEIKQR